MSFFTFPLPLPTWVRTLRRATPQRVLDAITPLPLPSPGLATLTRQVEHDWPRLLQESAAAVRYLRLFAAIDWAHFPDRSDQRVLADCPPLSLATFAAAYLIKLDQHLASVADLRQYLVDQPLLVWALGFPLTPSDRFTWGFDADACLPTHRHFSRLLRECPNDTLQFLLDETVHCIHQQGAAPAFGDCIAQDTKHILAWVKENNPKAYLHGKRFDQTHQPAGDPDCRVGCKRKSNQAAPAPQPATPTTEAQPARGLAIGEYYWGYASGIVSTQLPNGDEIVLAELTQPFDQPDVSYFHPLMTATTRRLGHPPRFGALDAAFDAFYVYEYFHRAGGFAAVPFSEKGGHGLRTFSPEGIPLCTAGLPMALICTFMNRSSRVEHECQRYACPLHQPDARATAATAATACPVNHARWPKGGCTTTLAASIGARLRHQLDRDSAAYQDLYRQRTSTERINSQAVALGIERPHLRNQASIANHNTLIYVLINLHALQRISQRQSGVAAQSLQAVPADPA